MMEYTNSTKTTLHSQISICAREAEYWITSFIDWSLSEFSIFGCNMGALLESFPKSWDKVGIDLSRKALDIGHNKTCNVDFVLCDMGHLPLTREVVDLVICSEVLEHIIELGPAMDEVRPALKKGGLLVVTVPNLIEIYWWILLFSRFLFLVSTGQIGRIKESLRARAKRVAKVPRTRLTAFESHARILSPFAWKKMIMSYEYEIIFSFGILLLPFKDTFYRFLGREFSQTVLRYEDRMRTSFPAKVLSNGVGYVARKKS